MSMNQEQTLAYLQQRARVCTLPEIRQEWEKIISAIQSEGLERVVAELWRWLEEVRDETDPPTERLKRTTQEFLESIEHGPYSTTMILLKEVEEMSLRLRKSWEWDKILELLYTRRLHGFLLEVQAGEAVIQDFHVVQEEIVEALTRIALPYQGEMERIVEEEVYE